MILLMGSEGSIGKRYSSILYNLKIKDVQLFDTNGAFKVLDYSKFDKIIIATPTSSHIDIIRELNRFYEERDIKKPSILCEKPISKNLNDVQIAINLFDDFQMVFQYCKYFDENYLNNLEFGQSVINKTSYDFYNTGKDGFVWDLIQVIGLHKGMMKNLSLRCNSPTWSCTINNTELDYSLMNESYVAFLKEWVEGKRHLTKENIYKIHHKTKLYYEYLTT